MKILLVSNTDWYLYNFRLPLARFLRENGYEVALVSPSGPYSQRLRESGFAWIPWEVGRQSVNPLGELGAIARLTRIYRQEKPDLVHHSTIKPVLYGTLAARLVGVRRILNAITGRGYVFLNDSLKARLLQPPILLLYRLAFSSARVFTIFENDVDRAYFLQKRLARAACTGLIPGVGVDVQRFRPSPEPAGPPVVLYAGRMLWDKGLGVLIEAARLLRSRGLAFRLVLAGEPDPGNPATLDRAQIEEWAAAGEVEWWGFRADMETVLEQSHLVALPSFFEGVPTILLEAAAAGRPIVASDIPGCRLVVEDELNGLLVPPRDPTRLAEALERLVSSADLREQMGRCGRALAEERFSVERMNEMTLKVIRPL